MMNELVVARFRGALITQADIAYHRYCAGDDDLGRAVRAKLLTDAIVADATKVAIGPDSNSVTATMEKLSADGGLDTLLTVTRLTESALFTCIENDTIVEAWMTEDPSVDQTVVADYYSHHLATTILPERVRLRHILITLNDDYAENRRDAVVTRIQSIRQSSEPFEALAMRHSECPTALNGGDLGWARREDLFPAIAAVAFAMAPMAEPHVVESPLGLHLVQTCDKEPIRLLTKEEGMRIARKIIVKNIRAKQMQTMISHINRHVQLLTADSTGATV